MIEKKKERVSVDLPEVVQAFGAFQKTLIETLVACDAISVAGARRAFQKTRDNLLNADAKGAAAVLDLMHEQIRWDEFNFSPVTPRRRASS